MKKIGILVWVLWMAGLISCTDGLERIEDGNTVDREVVVRLVVARPYSGEMGNGKTVSDPETEINEIQILVFEEGKYSYRVPGISITNSGATASFSARLLASDKMLDLYIVANATADVLANEPEVGDTEEKIRVKLFSTFSIDGSFAALPMFGRYNLPSGLQANQLKEIDGVRMLRAIARVDVLVGDVSSFELVSIQAYRANDRIQLVSDQETIPVSVPSVPAESRMIVNTEVKEVVGNQSVAEVYLPESVSPAESEWVTGATCIIVGGKYEGSGQVTYYRIDFDPNNTNGSFGQILRNHRYVFTVRSVAGPGWPSADEAANNRSAQINLEIEAWDESTTDMYFDTEHHFGVSTREIVLGSKQNSVMTMSVNTDVRDYTLQWSDEQGNVSGIPAGTLTNLDFKVEKTVLGDRLVVTALQDNREGKTDRTGYFVITANRWKILITIRQPFVNASNRAITFLSFRNSLGYFGVNLLLPLVTADSRGAGSRGILGNLDNFGPDGTVVCGGFNMLVTNASANTITDAGLAVADIIYFNYIQNSALKDQDIPPIRRWLESNPQRVLIVSYDGADVNVPLMTELLGTTQNIKWFLSNTGPYPLVGKSTDNFFTDRGPFTITPYSPVVSGFTFQNYDAYHGEIGAGSADGITPILNGPGGGIVLGIDESRRIIYMGDIDLNTYLGGTGATTTNHINNTTGNINNDAAKLIANVFAWAVQIVTGK